MKLLHLCKTKIGIAFTAGFISFFTFTFPAASSDVLVTPPPKSMDKYYADPGMPSEWITQMRKLNTAFSAIFISMDKKKWNPAEKNAALFFDLYKKASEMVPEWEEEFNLKAANEFKESILTKDRKIIEAASKTLKKTCSNCHLKNNNSVWIQYHWPSTESIKVLDPLEEKEVNYQIYMNKLSNSLERVTINFEQENFQQAWKALDIFTKRLTSLRSVCSKCHVTEWTKSSASVKDFFVGGDIMDSLQKIKKEFATGEPSEKVFRKNMDHINKRSCKMCHLVHQPTAFIQRIWKQKN